MVQEKWPGTKGKIFCTRTDTTATKRTHYFDKSNFEQQDQDMQSLERFKQRFNSLQKAYKLFLDGLKTDLKSDLEVAGMIQTFMFNFELFWKCLKDLLEYRGYENKAPRDVLKNAFIEKLIESDKWFEILDNRNIYSHTYATYETQKIVTKIKQEYSVLFQDLYQKLNTIYEMGS